MYERYDGPHSMLYEQSQGSSENLRHGSPQSAEATAEEAWVHQRLDEQLTQLRATQERATRLRERARQAEREGWLLLLGVVLVVGVAATLRVRRGDG